MISLKRMRKSGHFWNFQMTNRKFFHLFKSLLKIFIISQVYLQTSLSFIGSRTSWIFWNEDRTSTSLVRNEDKNGTRINYLEKLLNFGSKNALFKYCKTRTGTTFSQSSGTRIGYLGRPMDSWSWLRDSILVPLLTQHVDHEFNFYCNEVWENSFISSLLIFIYFVS